ncbi:MAG TPA: lyase family protein [Acidimicrobiia bacterium]|nr:lyase family protein [Acidimicrobiia bacterium]
MNDGPDYLGLGGRLGSSPGDELVDAGFALEMADAYLLHDGFSYADLAHVLALDDLGVVPDEDVAALLTALLEMAAVPPEEFPYDPAYGDPWNSRERRLEALAGPRAGWLTVGRPRREAARVAMRIALRRAVLDAHGAVLALAEAYLAQARRHRGTLMADFTYLQPAQPTTYGYVLAGHLQPVLRDLMRLENAYNWVNRSPAGAGGTSGSSLPVDRDRLAARLGFYGVIAHARDAMWQTDGFVELLATLAMVGTEAGQVAADLEIWASPQFGFVAVADEYCRVSALMPQKKNPYALPVIRHSAGTATGALTGLLTMLRTGSARTDHFLSTAGDVHRAVGTVTGAVRLLAGVVSTLHVDKAAMARSAADPGLVLADLADVLVGQGLGDRRTVHRLLGLAARWAAGAGRPVTVADVRTALTQGGIDVPPTLLGPLEDPRAVLASRTVTGGWARLQDLLTSASREIGRRRRACTALRSALDGAEAALVTEARDRGASV